MNETRPPTPNDMKTAIRRLGQLQNVIEEQNKTIENLSNEVKDLTKRIIALEEKAKYTTESSSNAKTATKGTARKTTKTKNQNNKGKGE